MPSLLHSPLLAFSLLLSILSLTTAIPHNPSDISPIAFQPRDLLEPRRGFGSLGKTSAGKSGGKKPSKKGPKGKGSPGSPSYPVSKGKKDAHGIASDATAVCISEDAVNIPMLGSTAFRYTVTTIGWGPPAVAEKCNLGLLDNLRGSCKGSAITSWGCDHIENGMTRSSWIMPKVNVNQCVEAAIWKSSYGKVGGVHCQGPGLMDAIFTGLEIGADIVEHAVRDLGGTDVGIEERAVEGVELRGRGFSERDLDERKLGERDFEERDVEDNYVLFE
ncbi:hypothetical protein MMC17_010180 [Xylographa soralifera]|nr:hypothetical protein [Xylographa soralifera]